MFRDALNWELGHLNGSPGSGMTNNMTLSLTWTLNVPWS